MDFESVNTLNVRFNLLAGNLLPMTNYSSFSLFAKIYSVVTWLIELIFIITVVVGCIYLPIEKTLEDGMTRFSEILDGIIFTFQTTFMVLQILSHKKLIHQFIQKLNEMLHIADETMKNTVTATLQPVKYPIKYYWTTGIGSTTFWNLIAFLLMFEKDLFYLDDYIIPIAISKQPFSSTIFAIGTSFITISAVLMVIKKVSVDLYMMHLILMTTTQYKYISVKLAKVCQIEKNDNKFKENYSHELNRKKELEIRALCRHHRDVIK
ncbi:hypothetical protein PUN28_011739 [Cardiocondyla obscurior]|uniref:Uncharacterized protein n=1 Tax=Cardiocondyla obscurior TaxID=286306 RepID=A0AAW2FHV0_9HYME